MRKKKTIEVRGSRPAMDLPIMPFYMTDPMSALLGGPTLHTPLLGTVPGPRKAKRHNKQKRRRTQQARRVNRR